MSKSIITHTVHSIIVGQKEDDGYLNITALAKAYEVATGKRKDVANWLALSQTKRLLLDVSTSTGYPVDLLVRKITTGNNENRGTWVHSGVVHYFKSWLESASNEKTEGTIRDALLARIGGEKEVPTLAGNVDLLTRSHIIEVKRVKCWKQAVGQIIVYGQDYPNHQKRIHLFGKASPSFLSMIRQYCTALEIEVTWEA